MALLVWCGVVWWLLHGATGVVWLLHGAAGVVWCGYFMALLVWCGGYFMALLVWCGGYFINRHTETEAEVTHDQNFAIG